MDKLKPVEIVLFAIIFVAIVVSFCYIFATDYLAPNEPISISSYDFSSDAYDVSVINSASFEDFLGVKGIGGSKATAIVEYREALGGFTSVYQIKDLNAINDTVFEAILDYFYGEDDELVESNSEGGVDLGVEVEKGSATTSRDETKDSATSSDMQGDFDCDSAPEAEEALEMTVVNINTADAETIAEALLLDISIAQEIVEVRKQVVSYSHLWELTLCESVDREIIEKISDFVIFS